MTDRELSVYLYENSNMIRSIRVEPQDTLRKLSDYEKYILAKEGKTIPTEAQDTIVIHDTVYIEVEAEQSQDIDIYVNTYPTYGRFYTPYFSHNWYGYGYDPFFYDPYFSYGYSYGYPYYHNHWYSPYYSYNYYRPNYNRNRQGVAVGSLGSRRYASNPNPWNRTYSNGYISAPNKAGVKNMSTTRTAASQQRATVQNNIKASQRPTYSKAVENGRTYTPTYTNPRMKVRPEYNSTKRVTQPTQARTQTQSRSVTTTRTQPQNKSTVNRTTQTQSRANTQSRSYSTPTRTQTQTRSSSTINRSTPTRTQTQSRSSSTINRSTPTRSTSSSVGRSTSSGTTSRSTSSGRTGKK